MSWALIVPIVVLVIALIFRFPIAISMLVASIFYFLVTGLDIGLVAQKVLTLFYSYYVLLAVPLFIYTGKIMNAGKVTEIVFKFAKTLVGRQSGGMAHVNVIASLIFSGMTGSAIADASGLGTMEIEAMRNEGYEDEFSCAVTAASATIGPIFPPSIPMVIYAMLSGASIGALFLGGTVPGILIAVALMIYIFFISRKRKYPRGEKFTGKEFLLFTLKAIPALLTPVILLGGIYGGVMTPTEAGAVAAFYALLISVFAYRVLGLKKLWGVLVDTVKSTGIIAIIVGAAGAFSFIVAREQVPAAISSWMLGITDNKYIFLLIVNILFLILGMLIDTSVLQLVFIPMVLPLVQAMGIDLVHFGVVLTLNMMIGLSTPPFGMLLFITSGISDTPLKKVIKETMPMVYVMLVVLILITYIPDIVMFVPELLGR